MQSAAAFSLDANNGVRLVGNLALTGTGHTAATGDALTNRLTGNAGNNTLDGGAGNDTLTGGAGLDTFVFGPGGGNDLVTDFVDTQDLVNVSAFGFIDFGNMLTDASLISVVGGVLIDFDTGDALTLNGITLANLSGADFVF